MQIKSWFLETAIREHKGSTQKKKQKLEDQDFHTDLYNQHVKSLGDDSVANEDPK